MKRRSENLGSFDLEKGYVPGFVPEPINDSIDRPLTQSVGTGTDAILTEFYYDGADIPGFAGDDAVGFYVASVNHRTGAVVRRGDPCLTRAFWCGLNLMIRGAPFTRISTS